MATANIAVSTVLDTVVNSATAISDVISSVSTGAKMINDYATDAREKQLVNIQLSRVNYEEVLMAQKAQELMEARARLDAYVGDDEVKAQRVTSIMAEYRKALGKKDEASA